MLKLDKNKGVIKKIPKTLAKIKKICIIDSVGAQTNRNEFNTPRRYRLETQAVFSYFFINFAKLLDNGK